MLPNFYYFQYQNFKKLLYTLHFLSHFVKYLASELCWESRSTISIPVSPKAQIKVTFSA